MTFAQIWFGLLAGTIALWALIYLVTKAIWPTLQKHKWVIGELE